MKRKASAVVQPDAKKRKTLPVKPVAQAALPVAAVPKETPTKQVKTPAKSVKATPTKQATPVQPVKKPRKENLAAKPANVPVKPVSPVITPPKVDSPTKVDPFHARRTKQHLSSPSKIRPQEREKDVDALLVGRDDPEFKKIQKYKSALDAIQTGKANSLVKDILNKPVPEGLDGISEAAIFKARLLEKRRQEKMDTDYYQNLKKLTLLEGLPLFADIIWSFFSQLKPKTLVARDALEAHLLSVHTKRLEKAVVAQALSLVIGFGPDWLQQKNIEGKEWVKVTMKTDFYLAAKENALKDYQELKKKQTLKY